MKDFFKYMAATVVGLIVFCVITGAIGMMCIVGMIASTNSTKDVGENSVMVVNLTGVLEERSESTFIDEIGGGAVGTIGLDDVLDAIKKAKSNDNIKGIYIEAGMLSADSYASLTAIRNALLDFKKSGKWIIAYGDVYTQGTYYVASTADRVLLNPSGQVDWHGIASQPIFLKDLMAKFGVKMQLAKVGAYKSAPEMFTADRMSDANREQVTAYVNGLWQNVCKGVSESRKISVAQLNAYADNFITLNAPEDFVKLKLVDKLVYADGIKAEINKMMKRDADESVNTVSVADMRNVKTADYKGEEIAIYYAYGDIVDSETTGMLADGHSIVSKTVCDDLEDLMEDDNVKAVVLRINSGGGSAYASEQIWHYVEMLKKKKPVVVSMGGMAASGGYYIASGADWIVAEPTTLTGSIGIFGMFPDMSELLTQKLGVKFDEVKTNKHSAFGTPARPFNEEEMSYLNKYIDRGYNLFRQRVADGRKMSVAGVEKIAQGRVWLGQDALKIKLVDELGGLDKAVAKAFMLLKSIDRQSAIQARVPFVMNIN